MVDLKHAKFKQFQCVKKKDGRDKKIYKIREVVRGGLNSELICYVLMYKKGGCVYRTLGAIIESALISIENK